MSFEIRRIQEPKKPSRVLTTLSWARRLRLPVTMLWGYIQKHRAEEKAAKRRQVILKRVCVVLVAVLCSLLLLAGAVKALVAYKVIGISQFLEATGTPLPTDVHGHTNLLLLGQGDETHDGVDLTDTLILASIDPTTESVAMISLPRDLYLRTTRMGSGRINALYRDYKYVLLRQGDLTEEAAGQAAMRELADELSQTFGIELHHVIKVDFTAFTEAVDALGGVDIEVPEDIYDTQYPDANYGYQTFSLLAGPQHLDGETALKYARSRHSTSDFDRSRRQQQLLQALAEKAKSDGTLTNTNRITDLLRIMEEHVATTLTFREMLSLANMATDIDRSKIISVQFNLEGPGGFLYPPPRDQFAGASVLVPTSWDEVRGFMQLILRERPLFLDSSPIAVLNAGAPSGSSRLLGYELIRYTLPVETMENYDGGKRPTSAILTPAGHEGAARTLATLLGIVDVATLPNTSTGTTIQILLGEDYRYAALSTLLPEDTVQP